MDDDFEVEACGEPESALFDHLRTEVRFGASIFWVRPALLFLETLEEFIAGWQLKRDGGRRGIVEVIS